MKNNNLVILTTFNNLLLKNRGNSTPIKKAEFKSAESFNLWNTITERILHAGYSLRIATREGREATKNEIYQFDIAFDCLIRTYFQTQSIILGDLATLKEEVLSHVCDIIKDKETPEEGRIPLIKGERAFRKNLEILLADRIVGRKYRTLEESLRLKEERALRRKAKREAEKAEKAAQKAQNSEVVETFQGEVVGVTIPALTLTNN